MKILVTGATGYIGGRLVPRLIGAGHDVHVLVRDPQRIEGRDWSSSVTIHEGDLLKPETLRESFAQVDAAYYLVHSMSSSGDFEKRDRTAAENFVASAKDLGHTIYLGGLQPEGDNASKHLRSRSEVGELLRAGLPVTEFRAGPIIGSGSASFEMVRYLTERLPIMITPRWVTNEVQPIGVRDIINYLLAALEVGPSGVVEVGADPLTFREMMLEYAESRGLKRVIIPVPVLTPRLAALWVGLVTPIPNSLAIPLVEGVVRPLHADRTIARQLFPNIRPMIYRAAVDLALERLEEGRVETRWSGALGDDPVYELEEKEGLIREMHVRCVDASADTVFNVFSSAGGQTGWFRWNGLWKLRGLMDQLVGGPGLRRGRRDAAQLYTGESIDFWRVEKIYPGRLLRLRAEMKLPGKAWLQWETTELPGEGKTELKQTAIFAPKGLWGMLYWWGSYLFHIFIFRDMISEIARRAELARGRT